MASNKFYLTIFFAKLIQLLIKLSSNWDEHYLYFIKSHKAFLRHIEIHDIGQLSFKRYFARIFLIHSRYGLVVYQTNIEARTSGCHFH